MEGNNVLDDLSTVVCVEWRNVELEHRKWLSVSNVSPLTIRPWIVSSQPDILTESITHSATRVTRPRSCEDISLLLVRELTVMLRKAHSRTICTSAYPQETSVVSTLDMHKSDMQDDAKVTLVWVSLGSYCLVSTKDNRGIRGEKTCWYTMSYSRISPLDCMILSCVSELLLQRSADEKKNLECKETENNVP